MTLFMRIIKFINVTQHQGNQRNIQMPQYWRKDFSGQLVAIDKWNIRIIYSAGVFLSIV